ncbi:hypothetical protein NO2_0139 [Candidatus Termititenax persephonae]|uniref:Uncharacterized protein n=1 Tax=Candidatus Termititenax persephonae TaxID=2218525 RepID=A0A388TEJ4_9BACT|nr:hypothetical protein NO2_0139 [Candidatus Termititenax persephonae]
MRQLYTIDISTGAVGGAYTPPPTTSYAPVRNVTDSALENTVGTVKYTGNNITNVFKNALEKLTNTNSPLKIIIPYIPENN